MTGYKKNIPERLRLLAVRRREGVHHFGKNCGKILDKNNRRPLKDSENLEKYLVYHLRISLKYKKNYKCDQSRGEISFSWL